MNAWASALPVGAVEVPDLDVHAGDGWRLVRGALVDVRDGDRLVFRNAEVVSLFREPAGKFPDRVLVVVRVGAGRFRLALPANLTTKKRRPRRG